MSHTANAARPSWMKRTLCLLLTAVLLLGMIPALTLPSQAHWADPYLDQLIEWGFMRGDQATNPDEPLTRADFMAIVNRAYGYHELGPIPFEDVQTTDWFYDDVRIAYTANYISGTSDTTVSPNATLNRETVIYILGKNMLLQETPGESLSFADSRDTSDWSRGMVKTAVDHYLVSGYDDNTFRPKTPISKGEMAVLLTQCVGNPIQEEGNYELGDVFGNVTITAPGVTLRNTTISGDLYITGGVGLGDIRLENVRVLGRIIASGTGESEKGDASIVMRNVTADEMLVDNLQNQYVTIRAEGLTEIGSTLVRTPTYLEDNTPDSTGLRTITLEGEEGTRLDLAGRIKEVTTKTPNSLVTVAKGTVEKLTVDEAAVGARVQLDRGTVVKELNLDVGTNVSGQGDVTYVNINSAGSTLTMLPQKIFIRPGLTANVAGENMDSAAAEEASRDPMLLSGYPLANNVAPTGLDAVFAANKRGTIYWAVSPITDGSVGADDLISPPAYGSVAERSGSIATPSADTQVQAQITGLTSGGSYYLSAVLVDGRDARSPVKVISFTTPDNSIPAFAEGYPEMTLVTDTMAQVTVMPTKSCKMYYAVLPRSAQAPTAAELKSASIVGNLGYGVVDVVRNTESSLTVSRQLEELKEYTLYLWLTDANGANSSEVVAVEFTTEDRTPPVFTVEAYVNQIQTTSVRLAGTVNENATVYWAVVEEGTQYPKPQPGVLGDPDNNGAAPLDSEYARLQVLSGMNAMASGSVTAQEDTEFTMDITGLQEEKSYDLYYLARDTAGNCSTPIKKITIHTEDNNGPIVSQTFSKVTGLDNTQNPLPNSDIMLTFNENIRLTNNGGGVVEDILSVYKRGDEELLADTLRGSITMFQETANTRPSEVPVRDADYVDGDPWVIDYRKAQVTSGNDGSVIITFPTNDDPMLSALNLASGATYYFQLSNITDNSEKQNKMLPDPLRYNVAGAERHSLDHFTTVFAQVYLTSPGVGASNSPVDWATPEHNRVDLSFRMSPEATEKTGDEHAYDILLYTDRVSRYDLYYRVLKADGETPLKTEQELAQYKDGGYLLPVKDPTPDANGWFYVGDSRDVNPSAGQMSGRSVNGDANFNACEAESFPLLNKLSEDLIYEFVITLTQYGTSSNYKEWNGDINFEAYVVTGVSGTLYNLANSGLQKETLDRYVNRGLNNGGVALISIAGVEDHITLDKSFMDSQLPQFTDGYPKFEPGDSFANMQLNLTRDGTIYYVVVERGLLNPQYNNQEISWEDIPESGSDAYVPVTSPVSGNIFDPAPYVNTAYCGNISYPGGSFTLNKMLSLDSDEMLKPLTDYYVYLVLKGVSDELSPVYTYRFTTDATSRPKITLTDNTNGSVTIETNVPAYMSYILFTESDSERITWLDDDLEDHLGTHSEDGVSVETILPTAYEKYSLKDALLAEYTFDRASRDNTVADAYCPDTTHNGYSVFDIYADDDIKRKVGNFIRTGEDNSGADVVNKDGDKLPTTPREGSSTPFYYVADLDKMDTDSEYIIFTTGYHTSSSPIAGDSFRARENIVKLDMNPPELENFSGAISGRTPNTSGNSVERYDGSFSITFDKNLYRLPNRNIPGDDKLLPVYQTANVWTAPNPNPDNQTKDYIAITEYFGFDNGGTNPNLKVAVDQHFVTRTFSVTFTGLQNGATLTLFNNGYISNSNGKNRTDALTVRLRTEREQGDAGLDTQVVIYLDAKLGDKEFTVRAGEFTALTTTPNPGGSGGTTGGNGGTTGGNGGTTGGDSGDANP
ncbi:S-layer homology domain-containing protein [Oscillospiraceae bacterium 50-16]